MDRDALRDHIDQILVTIAADMKVPQTERERSEKPKGHAPVTAGGPDPAAETHGTLARPVASTSTRPRRSTGHCVRR
ncbi:hypothetical protein [Lysobacter sp. D1-1-M9]|uniref:hypothetical protein n=1 Tax=Novilysobacter longmucuonensis TaxID=3098603 RepID=UPI002FC62E27